MAVSKKTYALKYDIRERSPDYTKMGTVVTLTKEELKKLRDMLSRLSLWVRLKNKIGGAEKICCAYLIFVLVENAVQIPNLFKH